MRRRTVKYLDDEMSIGRLENKIYKIYSRAYKNKFKPQDYNNESEYSNNLFQRLELLSIPLSIKESLILSGSSVLAILGLRGNRDIDVLHPRSIATNSLCQGLASHNYQIRYLTLNGFWDIFMDPSCIFNWRGYKVLSPHLLLRLKKIV